MVMVIIHVNEKNTDLDIVRVPFIQMIVEIRAPKYLHSKSNLRLLPCEVISSCDPSCSSELEMANPETTMKIVLRKFNHGQCAIWPAAYQCPPGSVRHCTETEIVQVHPGQAKALSQGHFETIDTYFVLENRF